MGFFTRKKEDIQRTSITPSLRPINQQPQKPTIIIDPDNALPPKMEGEIQPAQLTQNEYDVYEDEVEVESIKQPMSQDEIYKLPEIQQRMKAMEEKKRFDDQQYQQNLQRISKVEESSEEELDKMEREVERKKEEIRLEKERVLREKEEMERKDMPYQSNQQQLLPQNAYPVILSEAEMLRLINQKLDMILQYLGGGKG